MKEFSGNSAKMSLSQFWLTTGPTVAGILLLTAIIAVWGRSAAAIFTYYVRLKSFQSLRKWMRREKELM